MNNTEKMNLALPSGSDYVDIETLNENFRKLDGHTHTPDEIGAATTFTRVANVGTEWISEDDTFLQWTEVEGLRATDHPIVDALRTQDAHATEVYCDCMSKIYYIEAGDGELGLWTRSEIDTAFQIQVKVVR